MRPWRRPAALAAGLLLSPPVWAHGASLGLSGFFGAVLHPLLVPAHLVGLLALGLALGQRGTVASRPAVYGFLAGLVLGLLGTAMGRVPATDLPVLLGAGVLGLFVAAAVRLPGAVLAVLAGLLGLGIGLGSVPEPGSGAAQAVALLGTGLGAGIGLLYVACSTDGLGKPWLLILVRVAGSWITASALLVLTLGLAAPG